MSDEKITTCSEVNSAKSILHRERGLLSEFQFDTPYNMANSTAIPLNAVGQPITLAQLSMQIDDVSDRVWLTGSVGFQVISNGGANRAIVLYKILRNAPNGSLLIYSAQDSGESNFDNFHLSTINYVDIPVGVGPGPTKIQYYLTAEILVAGSQINIVGPVTFTGAEIERNRICKP